jgi:putative oxidoreductase
VRTAATVSRILLGLILVLAGASGFFFLNNPPPGPPGMATTFMNIFFASRWVLFVDGMEFVTGALLLVNRYVALALLVIAAIIFNMYVFHITMMLVGIPGPLALTILWIIVANQHRTALSPLLAADA